MVCWEYSTECRRNQPTSTLSFDLIMDLLETFHCHVCAVNGSSVVATTDYIQPSIKRRPGDIYRSRRPTACSHYTTAPQGQCRGGRDCNIRKYRQASLLLLSFRYSERLRTTSHRCLWSRRTLGRRGCWVERHWPIAGNTQMLEGALLIVTA